MFLTADLTNLYLIVYIPPSREADAIFLFTTRSVPHLRLRGLREVV